MSFSPLSDIQQIPAGNCLFPRPELTQDKKFQGGLKKSSIFLEEFSWRRNKRLPEKLFLELSTPAVIGIFSSCGLQYFY